MKKLIEIIKRIDWASMIMTILVIVWAIEVAICFQLRADANKKVEEARETLAMAKQTAIDGMEMRAEALKMLIGTIEAMEAPDEAR